jgi:hypothetical protein
MNQQDIALLAKQIVAKVESKVPIPTMVPGTVVSYDGPSAYTTVALDGDEGAQTGCINITSLSLAPGDRVMVSFFPPRGIFVTGLIPGASGVINYTPVLTTGGGGAVQPTMGTNSTVLGNYIRQGLHIEMWVTIIFGSTATVGVGVYEISVPESLDMTIHPVLQSVGEYTVAIATNNYAGIARVFDATKLRFTIPAIGSLNNTSPAAFAVGDKIQCHASYIAL